MLQVISRRKNGCSLLSSAFLMLLAFLAASCAGQSSIPLQPKITASKTEIPPGPSSVINVLPDRDLTPREKDKLHNDMLVGWTKSHNAAVSLKREIDVIAENQGRQE